MLGNSFISPEAAVSHFNLQEGDLVADFGAGSGYFLPSLSAAVGETGRVYALEIQKVLIEKLGSFVRSKNLENVDIIWADLEAAGGAKLPDGSLDAVIMVNILFQAERKEILMAEARRVLKRGGSLHIIDWQAACAGVCPSPETVVSKAAATDCAESNQFTYVRDFPVGSQHYGLTFRAL